MKSEQLSSENMETKELGCSFRILFIPLYPARQPVDLVICKRLQVSKYACASTLTHAAFSTLTAAGSARGRPRVDFKLGSN